MNEFLSDNNNQSSMMRLMAFICIVTALLIAVAITIFGFIKGNDAVSIVRELIYLCFGILGFGFGGKVIQKMTEKINN